MCKWNCVSVAPNPPKMVHFLHKKSQSLSCWTVRPQDSSFPSLLPIPAFNSIPTTTAPWCCSNTPGSFLPQGLCCFVLLSGPLSSDSQLAPPSLPARLYLKYYSLNKACTDHTPLWYTAWHSNRYPFPAPPSTHRSSLRALHLFIMSIHVCTIHWFLVFTCLCMGRGLWVCFSQLYPQHLEQCLTT